MRRSTAFGFCTALFRGLLCGAALAEPAPDEPASESCNAWELEYALSARVRLSNTARGAGDGVYDIGPGRLVLRVMPAPAVGQASAAELIDYDMQSRIEVRSKVLFFSAEVVTQTHSRVGEGVAGRGMLAGNTLMWSTPIRDYGTVGTVSCSGSACGMPGAPPRGKSPLRIGPQPVNFHPFVFAGDDLETFQMAYAPLTSTEKPRQTSHITLAGRKLDQRCVAR